MDYTANTTNLTPRSSATLTREAVLLETTNSHLYAPCTGDVSSETYRHTGTHIYLPTYLPACLLACRCIRSWAAHGETLHAAGVWVGIRVYVPGSDTQPWLAVDATERRRTTPFARRSGRTDEERRRDRVADGDGDRRRRFLGSSNQHEDERGGQRRGEMREDGRAAAAAAGERGAKGIFPLYPLWLHPHATESSSRRAIWQQWPAITDIVAVD